MPPGAPTHAEGFNQNVSSQGFGSANLARRSLELFRQYLAISLIFGVQAAELRTSIVAGHYGAQECLSPATVPLYSAIYAVIGRAGTADRPLVWNDDEQELDQTIDAIAADIEAGGRILAAIGPVRAALL